jgi:transketolase
LKTIPGAQIYVPGHPAEFAGDFFRNYDNGKLNYFRLSERSNSEYHDQGLIKRGTRGTVVAIGPMLDSVVSACEGLDVEILYRNKVEPMSLLCDDIVVEPFYEHTIGSKSVGIPRRFITRYGTVEELDAFCGLTVGQLRARIERLL